MMDVVARHKGKYGGRMREPGDVFSLTDKAHFSTRWMVKARTAEAKVVSAGVARGKSMTAEQVAAEEAMATGKVSHKAEMAAKNARIAELEAEVETLRAHLKVAMADVAEKAEAPAELSGAAVDGPTEAADPAREGEVPPERVSRRRRAT